jgi:hypothetical protein
MKEETLEKREESITLNRGLTGKYGWEIKLYRKEGETYDQVVERMKIVDKELTDSFILTKSTEVIN